MSLAGWRWVRWHSQVDAVTEAWPKGTVRILYEESEGTWYPRPDDWPVALLTTSEALTEDEARRLREAVESGRIEAEIAVDTSALEAGLRQVQRQLRLLWLRRLLRWACPSCDQLARLYGRGERR